ncbi:two-component sensor histidine kinase [Rugosimonospora africana]|uniref:histidine kinase n=1 Tax=Rugosimonospora africana TaxID=556532 RepID=A0A8J3VPR3_9ACTN|nr:two-component sensor histidine kinase [Rugosimonospora africana]
MLRVANVSARILALAIVGVVTFIADWPGRTAIAVEIVAFTTTAVLMAAASLVELSTATRERYAFLLPYLLGTITVLCATVAAAVPSADALIYLSVIAMISAGTNLRLSVGWILVVLGTAGTEAAGLPQDASPWITVQFPCLLLLGLLLGFNRGAHRVAAEQAAALLARSEELRKEQALVATLDERARIAREIHDVLAHSLGALAVNIQVAQAALTDQHDVSRAVDVLGQARRMATDGLTETRRAVQALRGEIPPLADGLVVLSSDHQRRHGARVLVEVTGQPRELSPDARLAIARVAQEALVNSAKHAPHQPVEIRLAYADRATSLVVSNRLDGAGTPQPGFGTVDGGYGLAGMRERLLLLDGTLSAGRTGTQWVVVAKVPQ